MPSARATIASILLRAGKIREVKSYQQFKKWAVLRLLSAMLAIVCCTSCGSTDSTTPSPTPSPTTPSPTLPPPSEPVPTTVQLNAGDIVYRRAANGQRELSLVVGTGTTTSQSVFGCEVFIEAGTDNWPCRLRTTLNTNVDYWLYLLPQERPFTGTDGLLGGEVWIRNQRLARRVRISDFLFRQFMDAAAFKIVDVNGTIE